MTNSTKPIAGPPRAAQRRARPANVEISHRLGTAIVTGKFAPGFVLPGEVELSLEYNVSRSVMREAMKTLSSKRLVESRPKTGTRVRPRADWNLLDPDVLSWTFSGKPSVAFVRDLFRLRMILEPAAAELAAVTRNARQLSSMGHALETMAQAGLQTDTGQAADQRFHNVLLEATGSELLSNLSSTIGAAVRWTTFFKSRHVRSPRDSVPEHRVLFEAIAARDASGAREATAQLISLALADTEMALDRAAKDERKED